MAVKRISPSEIARGVKVEREHIGTVRFIKRYYAKHKSFPANKTIFKEIAMNHLRETPVYYKKLKKARLWTAINVERSWNLTGLRMVTDYINAKDVKTWQGKRRKKINNLFIILQLSLEPSKA